MVDLSGFVERVLRFRWVLAVLLGGFVIIYELSFHGLDALRQLKFNILFEIAVMGIIIPLVGGFLLSHLARFRNSTVRYMGRLDRYKSLLQELGQRRELAELMKFLVQYPETFLPVERTWLYIYDHRLAQLERVAEWNFRDKDTLIVSDTFSGICDTCLVSHKTSMHPATNQCPLLAHSLNNHRSNGFCLSFTYNKLLIGILRINCRPGVTLTQDQIEFLKVIAPEIALALVIAIAYPRQMAQVRLHTKITEQQQSAIDLHNTLAQQIGFLHLGLDRIASKNQSQMSNYVRDELEDMRQTAADAYQQVRNTLALHLSWETVDLTQVLMEYAIKVSKRAHLSNKISTVGEPVLLPMVVRRQILSLFQESLNNVEKYARAKRLNISLVWLKDCLIMVIADDGVGFDPSRVQTDGHFGLMLMHDMVKSMRGYFEINSSPGQGTRLTFKFPLPRAVSDPVGIQSWPIQSYSLSDQPVQTE